MLESKIDQTNELIHKLIDEVFPSVYTSLQALEKRINSLEGNLANLNLKVDSLTDKDQENFIKDDTPIEEEVPREEEHIEGIKTIEEIKEKEIKGEKTKEEEKSTESGLKLNEKYLEQRQIRRILQILSCNYKIDDIKQCCDFFDISDKLFEVSCQKLEKRPEFKWPIPTVINVFNLKYEYWVTDEEIVEFCNKSSHECEDIVSRYDSKTKLLDWDRILMKYYQRRFNSVKDYQLRCIEIYGERTRDVSRPGANFENLRTVTSILLENVLFGQDGREVIDKLYVEFPLEMELTESKMKSRDFSPDDYESFLKLVNTTPENLDNLKYDFLEDLKRYLRGVPIVGLVDPLEYERQFNNYCVKLSKFWDNHQFENLFFLLYFNNNIDRILDAEKLQYYKYLKYELLERLNFLPMVVLFVIMEINQTWLDSELAIIRDDLLIISSMLITSLKFRNVLESHLFILFNSLNYEKYLEDVTVLDSQMFKLLGDLVVENIDLLKNIIREYIYDLKHKPLYCLSTLRNPLRYIEQDNKLHSYS